MTASPVAQRGPDGPLLGVLGQRGVTGFLRSLPGSLKGVCDERMEQRG